MSDSLKLLKQLAGLNEMESDPGQAIGLISSLKTSMEHLESMVNGGRGNPMQVISQMENALNILKQHFASAPRQ
jgi:hypothetical protein